ncbi:MAG: protein-export chaperone SecB [Magnetococcales bacterium]|nr:protein-export chaperone SecB [Magnetococcales bacterium]
MAAEENSPPPPPEQPVFHVEKLYLKDLSFESPNSPEVFREPVEPRMEFNLETNSTRKGEEHYESVLHVTVKVYTEEQVLFLVDVSYGGLFLLRNIPKNHVAPILGIECPNILFPYVRRVISEQVTDGGFKPVVLDPVNFAALFQQRLQQQAQKQAREQPAPEAGTD